MSPAQQKRSSRKQYAVAGVAILVVILIIAAAVSWSTPSLSSSSAAATSLSIQASSIQMPLDNNSVVTAILSTVSDGTPVSNETVQWLVNGQPAGNSTTDESGTALLPLESVTPSIKLGGNYTIVAEFNGDSAYLQSNDTTTVIPYMDSSDYYSMVYNQTIGLLQSGNFPSLSNATGFTGTYVVYDLSNPTHSSYVNNMPFTVTDPSSTVFLVKTTQLDLVGQYFTEGTNAPGGMGYNAQFDIYVIKYPELTPIGKYSITSAPPTISNEPHGVNVIGNYSDWQNWISQHTPASSNSFASSGDATSFPAIAQFPVANVTRVVDSKKPS